MKHTIGLIAHLNDMYIHPLDCSFLLSFSNEFQVFLKLCHKNAGYLFSLNHARLVVLLASLYAIYCVKVRAGWFGVLLSINLSFFSNDALNYMLQWCDNVRESTPFEQHKQPERVLEDDYSGDCEYSNPFDEPEKSYSCKSSTTHSCKSTSRPSTSFITNNQKESSASKVTQEQQTSSLDEMKRILNSSNHYEALGFPCHKKIDAAILKKEYRKKVDILYL